MSPSALAFDGEAMTGGLTPDEDLVRRLPLPLAQLYRRAHNAKTALDGTTRPTASGRRP